MFNSEKLDYELREAGIPIDGCNSQGTIWFRPEATPAQVALADALKAAHEPKQNREPGKISVIRQTTNATPVTLSRVLKQYTMADIRVIAKAFSVPGGQRMIREIRAGVTRGGGIAQLIGTPENIFIKEDAGAVSWITNIDVSGNSTIFEFAGLPSTTIKWSIDLYFDLFFPPGLTQSD